MGFNLFNHICHESNFQRFCDWVRLWRRLWESLLKWRLRLPVQNLPIRRYMYHLCSLFQRFRARRIAKLWTLNKRFSFIFPILRAMKFEWLLLTVDAVIVTSRSFSDLDLLAYAFLISNSFHLRWGGDLESWKLEGTCSKHRPVDTVPDLPKDLNASVLEFVIYVLSSAFSCVNNIHFIPQSNSPLGKISIFSHALRKQFQ